MDQFRWELLAVSIRLDWAFTGYSHSAPEFPEFLPSSWIMPHHRGVSTCAASALQCVSASAPSPYMETCQKWYTGDICVLVWTERRNFGVSVWEAFPVQIKTALTLVLLNMNICS